jgi:thiol-disulfide isomerase/thioredoxin
MKKILICLLIVVSTIFSGTFTMEQLQKDLEKNEGKDSVEIYKEYIKNGDIDVAREVQSLWSSEDSKEALKFFKSLNKIENSAKSNYMLGRVAETEERKIELGRESIKLDPSFSYGYRLIAYTYSDNLFSGRDLSLSSELEKDSEIFEKLYSMEKEVGSKPYYEYLIYSKKYDLAEKILLEGVELKSRWASDFEQAIFYLKWEKISKSKSILNGMIDQFVTSGRITKDEREDTYISYLIYLMTQAEKFDLAIEEIKSINGWEQSIGHNFSLGSVFAHKGDFENSFNHLNSAANLGFESLLDLDRGSEFEKMKSDKRWKKLLGKIEENRENGKDKRRKEALSKIIKDRKAPDWELVDYDGNSYKLSEMKGKVLILDFWATWCGPCKMAMPEIDKYIKTKMPSKGVEVFSINVWEKGKDKPKKFMEDHDYSMKLIYGTKDITKDYGIQGIPYICVIDQDGNIKFEEKGFSEYLGENLEWWVDSLIK